MTARCGSPRSRASRAFAPGRWAPTPSDRADATDAWLTSLLGDEPDVALVAIGGYGRRELCPHSDLDVLLLHRGRKDISKVADRIWYAIWDAGVALDHSVRTPREALAVAESDVRAALGLLDARCVAGDAALVDEVTTRVDDLWRARVKKFLPALDEEVQARHARMGPVAFLLEPDVKEGDGGLRDVQLLRAVARATPVVRLTPDVDVAYRTLLAVRVALHDRTGRAQDRLLLEEQDGVAADLGYPDADALMRAVASAGRLIGWTSDDGWRRVRSALRGPRGRSGRGDRAVGPGLVERDQEIVVPADADVAGDPSLPVRAVTAAAWAGVPVARATLERFATETDPPPEPWPAALLNALVGLLGTGRPAVDALEALDRYGLVERLLPEWGAVRNKPQRNAYHRFTVDRHLCEAAANSAALVRQVERPDLLLVGTWLHDIGKGFPGDHTVAGVEVVERIATRMGFDRRDVTTLVAMVRHHLLLPDVATRRDLEDPVTITAVAEAVGDRVTLELLAALTEADSLATGPAAWSDWKAGLVAELVDRVRAVLAGEPLPPPSVPTHHHREVMARREVVVEVAPEAVTVIAPDRPGLLAAVTGALAVIGLDVRSAAVGGEQDMAVEVLDVTPRLGDPPPLEVVEEQVRAAVDGRLPIDARLQERRRDYGWARRAVTATPSGPVVRVDADASPTATVIEVRAPDGEGVLYELTRALAGCGLDIRSAKVSTLGHEVIDAFYVTPPLAPDDQERVVDALLAALA